MSYDISEVLIVSAGEDDLLPLVVRGRRLIKVRPDQVEEQEVQVARLVTIGRHQHLLSLVLQGNVKVREVMLL